jgi:hypothetical protein
VLLIGSVVQRGARPTLTRLQAGWCQSRTFVLTGGFTLHYNVFVVLLEAAEKIAHGKKLLL